MKYNRINQKIEDFQEKFDKFESKHYLEIQNYKEFKKENFSNVDKFSNIVQKIWSLIATLVILFCISMFAIGLLLFLAFTVLR